MLIVNLFIILYCNPLGGSMEIYSPEFKPGQSIPKKFTCQGENISPALIIKDIPKNTQSLALILEDPDAPSGTFDHWIAWNIPVTENIPENAQLSNQGINHFGKKGYGGPCPPLGSKHRYYFKLYALDNTLSLADDSHKSHLLGSIKGHVLEEAQLMGTYQKE